MKNNVTLKGRSSPVVLGTTSHFDQAAVLRDRRKALLESLIEQLNLGSNVSIKSMKKALKPDEYLSYLAGRPPSIKRSLSAKAYQHLKLYGVKLREADRLYAWAESLKNAKRSGLYRFHYRYHLADAAYDTAYQILEELCGYYPAIIGLLDRPVHFGWGEYPSWDPESAPRLIGSRSQHALHGFYEVKNQNIADKLHCLKASLLDIDGLTETTWLDLSVQTLAEDMGDDIPLPDSDPPYQPEWDGEFDFEQTTSL